MKVSIRSPAKVKQLANIFRHLRSMLDNINLDFDPGSDVRPRYGFLSRLPY